MGNILEVKPEENELVNKRNARMLSSSLGVRDPVASCRERGQGPLKEKAAHGLQPQAEEGRHKQREQHMQMLGLESELDMFQE